MRPKAEALGYPIFAGPMRLGCLIFAAPVVFGYGLNGGKRCCFGGFACHFIFLFFAFFFFVPFAEDADCSGFAATVFDNFGGWSEWAEVGVVGEFFDGCGV